MFTNTRVECFEPDSGDETWKHYRIYYRDTKLWDLYDFNNLFLYNCTTINGKYCYINEFKSSSPNRYFALSTEAKFGEKDGKKFCFPSRRLGGECDFNFNDDKYGWFKRIILDDNEACEQLERCRKMHHTLLNFSLMEGMGNLQGFKGSTGDRLDRLDRFVYELDRYFKKLEGNALAKYIQDNRNNGKYLEDYLGIFDDIYDYCKQVYFIEGELVNDIIASGKKSIEKCDDVVRYMDLAEKFWDAKESYFLEKEFSTIGSYFPDGGEAYTLEDLLSKLENDLGLDPDSAKELIEKSVARGFIVDCGAGTNLYTK